MKKKSNLKKISVAVGVAAMSIGLFNSFNVDASAGSGVCCQVTGPSCMHPIYNIKFADSIWEIDQSTCD